MQPTTVIAPRAIRKVSRIVVAIATGVRLSIALIVLNTVGMTIELTVDSVVPYLRRQGHLGPIEAATARPLAWGVSNLVLRVDAETSPSVVLKQSQPRLRTKVDWFSRCERIYREADVLRILQQRLPAGTVPHVVFEDRPNYILGLSAIRADHEVWKAQLLAGTWDVDLARRLGTLLGTIHCDTALTPSLLPDWSDWSLFDELRIDPFYRFIARVHPAIAPAIDRLLVEMARHRVCLVLADFSPKNVLVHPEGVSLVDFETGHYGDPAFDIGFILSHLLLKLLVWRDRVDDCRAVVSGLWSTYAATCRNQSAPSVIAPAATSARAVTHLAACLLARVDGKSPVDYLANEADREFVRRITLAWFRQPPPTVDHALDEFTDVVNQH